MGRITAALLVLALTGCATGTRLPAPNTAQAHFEPQGDAVQVIVSEVAPVAAAALVSAQGDRYPAAAVTLLSGPHLAYSPPPTVGFGIGGFGFSGCCSGFGSGLGVGVPVGSPSARIVGDQYVSSVTIPVPPGYAAHWPKYPRAGTSRQPDAAPGGAPGRLRLTRPLACGRPAPRHRDGTSLIWRNHGAGSRC